MAAEQPRRLSASPRENASAAASLVAMQRYADGFSGLETSCVRRRPNGREHFHHAEG